MNQLLFDHLWQSTMVLAIVGLLTLLFRNNGAHVRHALWTAASFKFLIPFAVLNGLGIYLMNLFGLRLPSFSVIETLYAVGQPFSDGPLFRALPSPGTYILQGTAIWVTGIVAIAGAWISRWLKLRAILRQARPVEIAAPMPVKVSLQPLEPGLVGILRPILLLPEGIADKLTPAELHAIVTHEACHMRRRDNLTALLHMIAQALCWFYPPVWWLGTRLIAERERACDEAVLAAGHAPVTYAAGILKVCKFYVQSPLACAAGIAGSDLSKRMETIMENRMVIDLSGLKKFLLGGAAAVLVLTPIAAGLLWSPAQGATCKLDPVMQTHTLVPYPQESIKAGETGTVLLLVSVAADGHATGAKVQHGSGFARLDETAASYVKQHYLWRAQACKSAQTDVKVVFALAEGPAPKSGHSPVNR